MALGRSLLPGVLLALERLRGLLALPRLELALAVALVVSRLSAVPERRPVRDFAATGLRAGRDHGLLALEFLLHVFSHLVETPLVAASFVSASPVESVVGHR